MYCPEDSFQPFLKMVGYSIERKKKEGISVKPKKMENYEAGYSVGGVVKKTVIATAAAAAMLAPRARWAPRA